MYSYIPDLLQVHAETAIRAAKTFDKPVVVVIASSGAQQTRDIVFKARQTCLEGGLPVYPTDTRASRAISRYILYHESKGVTKPPAK